ncbi:reverse transcriptase domain-containing protein [Tanacetum coccineum]|uniref:Reverse transcriptase domain-containing protein n=1 Tax=Tanacetum coccineum TaxID=301880 RepID=A0ABQ4XUG0_9ASTR
MLSSETKKDEENLAADIFPVLRNLIIYKLDTRENDRNISPRNLGSVALHVDSYPMVWVICADQVDPACMHGKKLVTYSKLATMDSGDITCKSYRSKRSLSRILLASILQRCPRVAEFGGPVYIISDRGTHFAMDQFAKVVLNYEVTHRLSTAYHPQTVGRMSRIFEASRARGFCPSITRASNPQLHFGNPISKSYRLTFIFKHTY